VGKTYYVVVHGKRILVEELDTREPPKPRRRSRLKKTWAKIPHERGIELAKRTCNSLLAVLLALQHICHWKKSNRVTFTNDLLGQYGISSQSKLRGLRQLERAGVVEVEWKDGAAPVVTHLWYNDRGELT
jgi:hypothetical protein